MQCLAASSTPISITLEYTVYILPWREAPYMVKKYLFGLLYLIYFNGSGLATAFMPSSKEMGTMYILLGIVISLVSCLLVANRIYLKTLEDESTRALDLFNSYLLHQRRAQLYTSLLGLYKEKGFTPSTLSESSREALLTIVSDLNGLATMFVEHLSTMMYYNQIVARNARRLVVTDREGTFPTAEDISTEFKTLHNAYIQSLHYKFFKTE